MSRVQLALNVSDLEASIAFYSTLFATEPHKRRPGYANFAIENPPLKLVLIEVPGADRGHGVSGALNHLGVEVFDGAEVAGAADRLTAAGLATFDEADTTCCYALQDKVWVHDPAGTPWEVYIVKDDNPMSASAESTGRTALPMLGEPMPGEPMLGEPILGDQGACCTPTRPQVAQA